MWGSCRGICAGPGRRKEGGRPWPGILWVVLLCLGLASQGCDSIYRVLQKEGAEEKDLLGEVVPFEYNAKVAEVQKLLKLYGYKIGRADGVLGANTREAIEAFQADNHLKVSRFVDKATWQRLTLFARYGLVVNGELDIAAVQRALIAAGQDPGKPDGKRGAKTDRAIKAFQKAEGLTVDGKIGLRTLDRLADYLPDPAVQPAPQELR